MDADPYLLFGKLAVKAGYLAPGQVEMLVREQVDAVAAGVPISLGELAQRKGMLTSEQVQTILLAQEYYVIRKEDRALGRLAVTNDLVTEQDVQVALARQKREYESERSLPHRIGEILVDMGVLSLQQIQALLSAQRRLDGPPEAPDPSHEVDARGSARHPAPVGAGAGQTTASEAPMGWLVQEAGEGVGRVFPLGAKALLGRQATNEVPIADSASSRQHARIEFVELARQHVLFDLNSRHGTFVNGAPVSDTAALQPGDRIQIGDTVLRYEAGAGVQPGFIPTGSTAGGASPIQLGSQRRVRTAEFPAVGRQGADPSRPGRSQRAFTRPLPTREPTSGHAGAGEWYVDLAGQPSGPYSLGELQALLRERKIDQYTVAWREGMTEWAGAGTLPELISVFQGPGCPVPPPAEAASAAEEATCLFCQECGARVPASAKFCRACGTRMPGGPGQAP